MKRKTQTNSVAARVDGELLAEVASIGSADCFEELVRRHGGMVLNVCCRLLDNVDDAEDAAQAVFLLLWKKAASLRGRETVTGWLHQVTRKVASNARRANEVREKHQRALSQLTEQARTSSETWAEMKEVLDEEVDRLPERFRLVIILFHLEGRSLSEIGALLGVKRPTVGTRLSRARELLRSRLTRRGIVVTTASLTATLATNACGAAVPSSFAPTTAQAATLFAAGKLSSGGVLSAKTSALAEGVSRALAAAKLKTAGAIVLASAVAVGGAFLAVPDTSTVTPEDLENAVEKWFDRVEFTGTYKVFEGKADSLENALAGQITGRKLTLTGRISKMDDKMRFSYDLGRPPPKLVVRGREVFVPGSFDVVANHDLRFFYDPYGTDGVPVMRIQAPRLAEYSGTRRDLLNLTGAANLRSLFTPSLYAQQKGVWTVAPEIGPETESRPQTHVRGSNGETVAVISEYIIDPWVYTKTTEFWTEPQVPVVKRVIRERRNRQTSAHSVSVATASEFVDCGGLMAPRVVRLVSLDRDGRSWNVSEWVSEDIGARPPSDQDFVIRVAGNALVHGIRELPPPQQNARLFDIDRLDVRDLLHPPVANGTTRSSNHVSWIIGVSSLVLLLAVSILVVRRRWT